MRWGIAFSVPAIYEADLWGLPPPSDIERQISAGTEIIHVLYSFRYAPQSKKEWQRVAGIKVQIAARVHSVVFKDYDDLHIPTKVYKVSELGKYFKARVKFPTPYMDGTPHAILTRHAKRLYYENMLHIEQLIFVSIWVKEIAPKAEKGRGKKAGGLGR